MVPTTSTFSSRHKESKDLADGNALKIQEKDRLEREIKDLLVTKDEIVRKSGHTPAEYKKIEDEHFRRMRELENGVVKARIEKDTVDSELSEKKSATRSLEERVKELHKEGATLISDITTLGKRKSEAEASTAEAVRTYDRLITDKSKDLALLDEKVGKRRNANILMTKEMDDRMASVVEQERLLSIRRNDLEIYEARLRTKYPNETIIL